MIDGIPNRPLYFYQKDISGWMVSFMFFDFHLKWDDDPHDKQILTGCEATSRGIYRGFIGL